MKMVLSQIASNVALCRVAQLHPLFPIPQYYELLHDLFTGDKWVYSVCFYHSVLLTSLFISHCCHKMKCTNCISLIFWHIFPAFSSGLLLVNCCKFEITVVYIWCFLCPRQISQNLNPISVHTFVNGLDKTHHHSVNLYFWSPRPKHFQLNNLLYKTHDILFKK